MSLEQVNTEHLRAVADGETGALDQVVGNVYEQLCLLARRQLGSRRSGTLDTSGLVHEVYLKFAAGAAVEARDKQHFMAIAATAMRHIIIDRARTRQSARRGGGERLTTLNESRVPWEDRADEALVVDQLMDRLQRLDQRLATTVECRYFAGYTESETADIMQVNVRTVRRYWKRARIWIELTHREN